MTDTQGKDITEIVENSYFFGQFMAYHLVLTMIELYGAERAVDYMKKKRRDIGIANQAFVIEAEKITKENIKNYYTDSMESKKTFIKGE